MKRDILMMGILTVFGCWGVHIGKINREISKFDREMKVMKQKGPMGVGEAVATVDGKVVVKAELTFMVG